MIKKRLLKIVPESKKYIASNVLFHWLNMWCNIVMVYTIAYLLTDLLNGIQINYVKSLSIIVITIVLRILFIKLASSASYQASKSVKKTLRGLIYEKLLKLGSSYTEHVSTAEVIQLTGEGVEQLETYFGQYIPQFFYAFLAPITLFFVICPISFNVAITLLVCVPLIPISIVIVQKVAKKLLKNYWGQYTKLADHFLENLQGLTTLKIYQADEAKHIEMNNDAEHFRKITMKVLTMQLNSIIVMDVVAYGGAALGILLALNGYVNHSISFTGAFIIILLSADFFLPMRQLGSFFHVAMNGMTASDKIFAILDLPETNNDKTLNASSDILIQNLCFSYSDSKETLHDVNMVMPEGSFTAIVGESGCGKSTIVGLLTNRNKGYTGSIQIGGVELSEVSEKEIMNRITLVSHNSYLFKGTIRENLLMGKSDATDEELWHVLKKVNIDEFVHSLDQGLDSVVLEGGSNFSGGQKQRIAIARALLHDSKIYIFDEATSNIDVESENDLMKLIISMTEDTQNKKTIILISHRLANVTQADNIYVLENGYIVQSGTHNQLVATNGTYQKLYTEQQSLENLYTEVA